MNAALLPLVFLTGSAHYQPVRKEGKYYVNIMSLLT